MKTRKKDRQPAGATRAVRPITFPETTLRRITIDKTLFVEVAGDLIRFWVLCRHTNAWHGSQPLFPAETAALSEALINIARRQTGGAK